MSKTALIGLTKALGRELGPRATVDGGFNI
jgi:hypothetical protein